MDGGSWHPRPDRPIDQGLFPNVTPHHLVAYSSKQYTNNFRPGDPKLKQSVNYVGNNLKNLKLSFEASLEKLRTSYVDILYLHYWDLHTSIEEIMDGLHNLVVAGKVLYLVSSITQYVSPTIDSDESTRVFRMPRHGSR